MIETQFFIMSQEQYDEAYNDAQEVGVNVDYFLMEFCNVEGDLVIVDKH